MRKTTCYKVTTADNQSLIKLTNGDFCCLTYNIGCRAVPDFGKLFCFNTLFNAQCYVEFYLKDRFKGENFDIYEGVGENPTIQKYLLHSQFIDIGYFWDSYNSAKKQHISIKSFFKDNDRALRETPNGTIVVAAFTPIKLVQ